jgi:hypothetical protein
MFSECDCNLSILPKMGYAPFFHDYGTPRLKHDLTSSRKPLVLYHLPSLSDAAYAASDSNFTYTPIHRSTTLDKYSNFYHRRRRSRTPSHGHWSFGAFCFISRRLHCLVRGNHTEAILPARTHPAVSVVPTTILRRLWLREFWVVWVLYDVLFLFDVPKDPSKAHSTYAHFYLQNKYGDPVVVRQGFAVVRRRNLFRRVFSG